jgi:hypothetical protein
LDLRPKPATRKRTRSIDRNGSREKAAFDPSALPHIADLIDYGNITVGVIEPVGCVATATDGSNCLAMLVRRDGETLHQLLLRLDLAVARAFVDDIFTDEVNVLRERSKPRLLPTQVVSTSATWTQPLFIR